MQNYFDALLSVYDRYFDITKPHEIDGQELLALASFHSRAERYVLSKRAQIWGYETDEFVLFMHEPTLDEPRFGELCAFAEKAQASLIVPRKDHMLSYVTLLLLCDSVDDAVLSHVRKYRFRRYYKFYLHGWMQMRIAIVDLSRQQITLSRDGKELMKILKTPFEKILCPA